MRNKKRRDERDKGQDIRIEHQTKSYEVPNRSTEGALAEGEERETECFAEGG